MKRIKITIEVQFESNNLNQNYYTTKNTYINNYYTVHCNFIQNC